MYRSRQIQVLGNPFEVKSVYRLKKAEYTPEQFLFFNALHMKSFMQMLLASFGILSLVLAGCSTTSTTEEDSDETVVEEEEEEVEEVEEVEETEE